jgi:hypothetical protein
LAVWRSFSAFLTIPWLTARRMRHVKDFDGIGHDPVEELERIWSEKRHPNAGALFHLGPTFWPPRDALLNCPQPLLEGVCALGIVGSVEFENLIEVTQRFVGEDDLHPRRCLANTASTC